MDTQSEQRRGTVLCIQGYTICNITGIYNAQLLVVTETTKVDHQVIR
jgi:hypothetical protein